LIEVDAISAAMLAVIPLGISVVIMLGAVVIVGGDTERRGREDERGEDGDGDGGEGEGEGEGDREGEEIVDDEEDEELETERSDTGGFRAVA